MSVEPPPGTPSSSPLSPGLRARLARLRGEAAPAPLTPTEDSPLSPALQARLQKLQAGQQPLPADPDAAGYYLVVIQARGWPNLERFADPFALARRLGELDGGETFAFAYHGQPLPFSQAPHRVLFLPTGQVVPTFLDETLAGLPADVWLTQHEVPLQEEGFLGPESLLEQVERVPAPGEADEDAEEWDGH